MTQRCLENIKLRDEEIRKGTPSKIVTGLVVQGGGMRGIYSMAALMALEECSLGGAFDHVIGSSAGAINGAYLLAEQAKLAVTVYLDDISNKNFINFSRLRKPVDIDFLVDGVLTKHKALDLKKVSNSFSTLHIVLTDYQTAEPFVVTNKDLEVDIMEAIRATAAMPILYDKRVLVKGREYIDGGLADSVPFLRAIELGCTDIVVVLTRPPSFRDSRPNLLMSAIESFLLRHYPAPTKQAALLGDKLYTKAMELLEDPRRIEDSVRILVVYPSDLNRLVSRMTRNRAKLLNCALMARNDTRRALGLKSLTDNPWSE